MIMNYFRTPNKISHELGKNISMTSLLNKVTAAAYFQRNSKRLSYVCVICQSYRLFSSFTSQTFRVS